MVQDRAIVTMADYLMHGLLNRVIFNDLEQPKTQISRSGHFWRWISPKWLKTRP